MFYKVLDAHSVKQPHSITFVFYWHYIWFRCVIIIPLYDSMEALPGLNSDKRMTEHKMKLRQETTCLGQIATVTAKSRISNKEWWFGFITSLNAKKR